MSDYLLIESRDPFETKDVSYLYGLLAAARAGVEVLADEFSLRERGIPRDGLVPGVKAAPIEAVIDALVEGRKVVWH